MKITICLFLLIALVAVIYANYSFDQLVEEAIEEVLMEQDSDMDMMCRMTQSAGVGIHSSGGCSDRNVRTCTSLDNIRCQAINQIGVLKRASGCSIIITGGTETGHASGTRSHLDISLNSCISGYITRSFSYIGLRGDGAKQYRASSGNVYALEGNHWDITFA